LKATILSGRPDLYSTRRLLEECVVAGLDSDIIDYRQCSLGIGAVAKVLYHGDPQLPNIVIPRIGHRSTRFGAAVIRQFISLGAVSTTNPGGLLRARDKLATMQALTSYGVPVPATSAARTPSGLNEVLTLVNGTPVVVKLLEGTHGSGVVLAETKKAAESLLAAFHQLDADMCVQEFIKQPSTEDVRALVVDGKVVAGMLRKAAPGEFRANLHQGGEALPIELSQAESDAAVNAARCVGLEVAGVDFLRTESGPLVLEVNASPGLQGVERVSNVNVAREIVNYALRAFERSLG
jgi:ribosomal protein S6--L-glutamate ligase